ncbi:hypothetical protein [Streptomyces capillispiralis]|uniref:Uncharacterized protein n=1 Tax=Streptomyces capillispiralis TaxID=68182 RepID=A0A561TBL6_9ACTN|nr:hypothetical protein [Streptomyces capillispiralis]TWF84514.1 hypothetical protein FHX78_111449 [Streptomyces capillispiralis]GHH92060.1 hypothetical protein GCM10017779_25170 [Streptomyces capillispiralis]
MHRVVESATGAPTLLFTAALVVVICFWLLVAVGATTARSFDSDADLRPLGMGGVPIAVAFSLLTLLAWLLATGTGVLLDTTLPDGPAEGLLRPAAACGALLAAWRLTRRLVRRLHRLFPDEPGPSRPTREPHADRDGASRAVPRPADGIRPRLPQNRGTG